MPDPLSIVVGVATLLRVAVHVGAELREFRDDMTTIGPDLLMLVKQVENLQSVLSSMSITFSQPELRDSMNATGHIGNHWQNVVKSLADTERAMATLLGILKEVNRKTEILDEQRRLVRYNIAAERMKRFVSQVASCKSTLQLSLETMIYWEQIQVSSTTRITVSKLDELSRTIETMGQEIGHRLKRLERQQVEQAVETERTYTEVEIEQDLFSGLRECVRSSWALLSSASSGSCSVDDPQSTPNEPDHSNETPLGLKIHVMDLETRRNDLEAVILEPPESSQPDHAAASAFSGAEAASSENPESNPFAHMLRRREVGSPPRSSPQSSPRVPQAVLSDDAHPAHRSPIPAVEPEPPRPCQFDPSHDRFSFQWEPADAHFGDQSPTIDASPMMSSLPEVFEEQSQSASVTLSPRSAVTTAFEISRPGSSQGATPGHSAASSPRIRSQSIAGRRRKLLCLGDAGCGKTALLQRQATGLFIPGRSATTHDNFECTVHVASSDVDMTFWDTSGSEEYAKVRCHSYNAADVVLLCFAINMPGSLTRIEEKWLPEMRQQMQDQNRVPLVLVGTMAEHTQDGSLETGYAKPSAEDLAARIGATKYFQTSAETGEGVKELFEHAAFQASIEKRQRTQHRSSFGEGVRRIKQGFPFRPKTTG